MIASVAILVMGTSSTLDENGSERDPRTLVSITCDGPRQCRVSVQPEGSWKWRGTGGRGEGDAADLERLAVVEDLHVEWACDLQLGSNL